MPKTTVLFILLLLLNAQRIYAQSITGFVYDEDNNPIPFAKVYVKNFTNMGGITSPEGNYAFGCDYGSYDLIFKCVGFEDFETKVTVDQLELTILNVYLKQKNNELNEVEITTKRKNMGWLIVQNVIEHKKDLIQQFDSYTCDIYIKGVETFDKKEKEVKSVDEEEDEPKDIFQEQKD